MTPEQSVREALLEKLDKESPLTDREKSLYRIGFNDGYIQMNKVAQEMLFGIL